MKDRLAQMLSFSGVTIGMMFAGLFVMLFLVWRWLPVAPSAVGVERAAMAAVLTTLVVSFSPAVTIAVIAEARARGPLSELVLTFSVLGDLALILFFTLAMQFARSASAGGAAEDVSLLIRLLWEIAGSLLYGGILGSVFALYLRFVGREMTLVLLGFCALITGTSAWLQFESLLTALAAGIVVENIAPPRGDVLRDAVERGGLPVLVIFFAAAGASLELDALAAVGPAVMAISIARFGWIWTGAAIGRRTARLGFAAAKSAWMGMLSQAGVTLGLAGIVASEFSGWGSNVRTLLIAMIALHQVIGPILFRYSLANAGEIGALDANRAMESQAVVPE